MEVKTTACPLDCPDSCTLDVTVEDGKVVKLDGNRINPVTDGYICAKVRKFPRHVHGEERLLAPLLRVGNKGAGEFREVSWDEALDLIAGKLREARDSFGGESILPLCYGGSNGYLTQDTLDLRLFTRLGASRILRTVCAMPTGVAAKGLYGKMPGVGYEDFTLARLIVLWGVNPSASGIHLLPFINRALESGAKLVVVDPRKNRLARKADLHLQPWPGTDLPLALSIIHWLHENGKVDHDFLARNATGQDELFRRAAAWPVEKAAKTCRMEAPDIVAFARLYTETSPAVIRCGWGLERNRNGGSAVASVLALPAVAGKFGVPGGGYTMSNSGAWTMDPARAVGAVPESGSPPTRAVNMNQAGRALVETDDRQVKVLFAYNCNPLAILPRQELVRQGLEREDLFTVVFDQVMTDSARYADVVLPATTFLEHQEIRRGYGSMVLLEGHPVIDRVGQSRPNIEVFGALEERLGLKKPGDLDTEDEITRALLAQTGRGEELRRSLDNDGFAYPDCGPRPQQFVDSFPLTEDRKIHLVPEALDREAPKGLYVFEEDPATEDCPLALISPASERSVSSTLFQLEKKEVPLEMAACDAEARDISEGDLVRVHNPFGEVLCTATISREMKDGLVFLPKGLWSHHTRSGTTSNTLCPDTLTDLGGGACFNDARVQVEKA